MTALTALVAVTPTPDLALAAGTALAGPLYLLWAARRPGARDRHIALRAAWFDAVAAQPGSEVLAVQTLRNGMMSATLVGTTVVMALMGTISLLGPRLMGLAAPVAPPGLDHTPAVLALALVLHLLAALVCTVLAVRHFNHADYVVAMPVGSTVRVQWGASGALHLRRAGVLYGWGLRLLLLAVPLVAGLVWPLAGLAVAAVMLAVLRAADAL